MRLKRQAGQIPIDFKLKRHRVLPVFAASLYLELDFIYRDFRGKAQIKLDISLSRHYIAGAGARVQVRYLKRGGWKVIIAFIPFKLNQFINNRCCEVNRIVGQVRIRDMPLFADNGQRGIY